MSKSGKAYGLIIPNKAHLSAPKAGNIFGDDNDSDDDNGMRGVKKALKAEGEKYRVKKQTRLNMEKALCEDPTIYQYDEVYDDMEREKDEKKAVKKEKQGPKYISNLLKAADRRKREQEHRIERMVQKEREAEGEKFADKESFVTSAYRAKLEEFKKMEADEERMDRLESIGDVTKQQDMSGFYRQLFAQTVDGEKVKEPPQDSQQDSDEKISHSSTANIDQDDAISTDSDSDDDQDSDHTENQKNFNDDEKTNIASKKSRQYRKRKVEASESEPESESEEEKPKKNDSNDVNDTVTHQENKAIPENTKMESPSKKIKLSTEHDEIVVNKEINNSENTDNFKVPEDKLLPRVQLKDDKDEKKDEKPPEKKVSIWEKRTVGSVLEDAIQRYYARKALRTSG